MVDAAVPEKDRSERVRVNSRDTSLGDARSMRLPHSIARHLRRLVGASSESRRVDPSARGQRPDRRL
ncbi:hypothetical protein EVAR_28514_1 [Eumeta japonica]|uniref:Uncharacterized protein n=1 Tax=Eumeta variegata TaxID=151549 RepID=A0A4C1WRI7_EUMVA|nr:hypothetical protein EVAR_28514_1 [Eumeta japonica]